MGLIDSCQRIFTFLQSDYHFGEPRVEDDRHYKKLCYPSENVGVIVYFEIRDQSIWVVLVPREADGGFPYESGVGLWRLVEYRGGQSDAPKYESPRWKVLTDEDIVVRLQHLANQLQLYARDVLEGNAAVLKEVPRSPVSND